MRKICFVVTTPFTANAFLKKHLAVLSKNFEVSLFVNLNLYKLSSEFESINIKIYHIPLQRKISPWQDLRSFWMLFGYFRRFKFDSIHSVTPKAGLVSMSAGWFAKIPVRIHIFTGQVWANKSGFLRAVLKCVDSTIAFFATAILADSKSQIKFLREERVWNSEKINVLGAGSISGVDLVQFSKDSVVREQVRIGVDNKINDFVFLFVGRLCRDKGIFDLLQAFEMVLSINQNIVLWLVGPDEENIQSIFKAKNTSIADKIRWIGPTFSPQNYMSAADLLVLPSYREGFGSVIIEAASCELPVVAYEIYGVVDAVVNNETGVLVEKGRIDLLAEQMHFMIHNQSMRQQLGKAAKIHAEKNFSNHLITKLWLNFYAQILQ